MPFFAGFVRRYQLCINKYPLPTQALTSAALMGVGDIVSQVFFERETPYSLYRTACFSFYGLIFVGPVVSTFYTYLDRNIRGGAFARLIKKVAVDQLLFAPVSLAIFLTYTGIFEGKTAAQIASKFENVYFHILFANWKVWPLFQIFSFSLVPLNYRVVATNLISILWNTFLSLSNSRANG